MAASRTHGGQRCSLSVVGPDDLEKTRELLSDLRQRIAHAINLCEDPGLIPTGNTLAAVVVQTLSTPMVLCRPCSADGAVYHQAPECVP